MRPPKQRRMTLEKRKALAGRLFTLPFLIGFIFLFFTPMITSLVFSFSETVTEPGTMTIFSRGLEIYKDLFEKNQEFLRAYRDMLSTTVYNVPAVILFSFFMAVVLNQKFHGRGFFRAIFFLPVILSAGVIVTMQWDAMSMGLRGQIENNMDTGFSLGSSAMAIVQQFDIGIDFAQTAVRAASSIYSIVAASGVQILIFLAGLQTVSPALFEASNMEGATSWENFWKITLPMISPLIVVAVVYTVIDTFMASNSYLMMMIFRRARQLDFTTAAAMSWSYSAVVLLGLGAVVFLLSKVVYYEN